MDLVVNMDLRIVLLCLGVLTCVQSFESEIVSSFTPRVFTGEGGPLFSTNLGSYPGVIYPVSKWYLRQWVYITSIGNPTSNLLSITSPSIYFYIGSDDAFSYNVEGDSDDSQVTTLVLSKWIFIAVGMNGEWNDFIYFRYRGQAPMQSSLGASPQLTTSSVYESSNDVDTFHGFFLDVKITIDEDFDVTNGGILSTFLCGAEVGTDCAPCHPSCLACATPGICDSCKVSDTATKSADGAYCVRNGVTTWDEIDYQKWSCEGCQHCIGTDEEICLSDQLASVIKNLKTRYSPPLTDETDGLICYRQPVPNLDCDPLTPVLGNLNPDGQGKLHPTADQCYKLLKAEWPYVTHWFDQIFPDFTPPGTSTDDEKDMLKTVLWLWILQYGPSVLKTNAEWQGIVTTFNNASLDWTMLLAWSGTLKGYSPDGTTRSNFPTDLETSLTQTSPEMKLFNYFSTLCASDGCSLGPECRQISVNNVCGPPK